SNRRSRRRATATAICSASPSVAFGPASRRLFDRTYGLKRCPSSWALARIRSIAAAITSELSSISSSAMSSGVAVSASDGGGGSFLMKDPQFGHGWSFGMGLLWADDRGHVEPPVLEDERRESGLVVRAAHLGHADSPLHLDVRDRMHLEFQDPVREEGLVPPRLGRLEPEERSLGSRLPEDERRRPEIPEPLEELEQLRPSIRELREDLEGLQRINHDQVDPIDVLLRRQGAPEELHPRFRRAL